MSNVSDIAVLGAGPAGANAALSAARHGLSVVLLDEQPKPGGQVWRAKSDSILSAPSTPESHAGDTLRAGVAEARVTHRGNTRVWQIQRETDVWHLHCLSDGRTNVVQARALILATGAREYVQPIPGWTLPGVLGLAGATALFKQHLTPPGQKTVVAGTGPLVFLVAGEIRRLGGTVAAVITPNSLGDWLRATPAMLSRPDLLARGALWITDLMAAGVPIKWGHAIQQVWGEARVSGVGITALNRDWSPTEAVADIEADSLCLGNGLIPSIEAARLVGLPIAHSPELGGWVPQANADGGTDIAGLFLCGDGAGIRGAAAAEIQGEITGLKAARFLGTKADIPAALLRRHAKAARFGMAMTGLSVRREGLGKLTTSDTILCRCESVSKRDIQSEIDTGAASANAVKSGLRAGMGPCGGKFCQTAVTELIAESRQRPVSDVPPPTPRPPLRPVPARVLAGDFDYDDLPIPKPAPL